MDIHALIMHHSRIIIFSMQRNIRNSVVVVVVAIVMQNRAKLEVRCIIRAPR